jgi:hypothetical protein
MDSTSTDDAGDLGKEVRQSLVLLGISMGVTALVTFAAQATLSLLG